MRLKSGPKPRDFLSWVDIGPNCWLWTGQKNRDGYGRYIYQRRGHMAHRWFWEKYIGPIPDGLLLMHTCDVRNCVNPYHLRIGTQADNIADKVSKNRQAKGEQNGFAKLTGPQAREIRAMARMAPVGVGKRGGNISEVAARFGVSPDTVRLIVKGRRWQHVSG